MTNGSRVYFDEIELAEPIIVRHSGENIEHMQLGSLIIEQRLTSTEANHISNTPNGRFYFDKLIVMIKGGTRFPKVKTQRLMINKPYFIPIQPKSTIEEIESKYRAEIQRAKNRFHIIQSLSAAYGAAIQLHKQLASDLHQDKWHNPSDIKHSLEEGLGAVESGIQSNLGDVMLLTFRDGESLPIPDSLEEQVEWIRVQKDKLGKLIIGLLQDKWTAEQI